MASLCLWGGLYGLAVGLVLPRSPRLPTWLLALGLLIALIGWFLVVPLKGQPVASGFDPTRMLVSILITGFWGIGVGVILLLTRDTGRAWSVSRG